MSDLLKIANIIARIALVAAFAALAVVVLQRIADSPRRAMVTPATDYPTVRAFNPDIDVPGAPIDGGTSAGVAMGCSRDPDGNGSYPCDEPLTPSVMPVRPAPDWADSPACNQSASWGKTGPVPHIPGAPLATVTEPTTDPYGRPSVRTPEFVDDEPVLYAHTSVWAATSDYLWTLMPAQSCQEHETTVWYRVDALRLAHPEIDWDVVPAGMPFMSIRGSHG